MSPDEPPRRAEIAFSDLAARQLEKLTAAEVHRLDRALAAISARPDLGRLLPDGRLRDYRDDLERVRVAYWVTVLRTVVVVAYIEV